MTLSFSGTGTTTVSIPGATVQPFKNVRVADSLQNPANLGIQNLVLTVSDINGGVPTDADGTFALSSPLLRQVAPGTYVLNRGPNYDAATSATSDLQNLAFTIGPKPSTAVIAIVAADNLNQSAVDRLTQVVAAIPPTKFIVTDSTAKNTYAVQGTPYSGPAGVSNQYVVQSDNPTLGAANLNITAVAPNVFIHAGSGVDAIDVSGVGGKNILDGGTNSNFLTGGAAGSGADTFFIDARDTVSDIWSTVNNFHAGDTVTLFGITPSSKAIAWADNQGTAGGTGLTLHATQAGAPTASFTLAGYAAADLSNGRLGVAHGAEPDGTPYLNVIGLK